MSLPPPGVNPTTIWIGRVGYFAGSSWADAVEAAIAPSTSDPRYMPIEQVLASAFIKCLPLSLKVLGSKSRHMNMQHGGFAVIECCKSAIDRGREIAGLGDALAVRTEGSCNGRKIPLFALTARHQP